MKNLGSLGLAGLLALSAGCSTVSHYIPHFNNSPKSRVIAQQPDPYTVSSSTNRNTYSSISQNGTTSLEFIADQRTNEVVAPFIVRDNEKFFTIVNTNGLDSESAFVLVPEERASVLLQTNGTAVFAPESTAYVGNVLTNKSSVFYDNDGTDGIGARRLSSGSYNSVGKKTSIVQDHFLNTYRINGADYALPQDKLSFGSPSETGFLAQRIDTRQYNFFGGQTSLQVNGPIYRFGKTTLGDLEARKPKVNPTNAPVRAVNGTVSH